MTSPDDQIRLEGGRTVVYRRGDVVIRETASSKLRSHGDRQVVIRARAEDFPRGRVRRPGTE